MTHIDFYETDCPKLSIEEKDKLFVAIQSLSHVGRSPSPVSFTDPELAFIVNAIMELADQVRQETNKDFSAEIAEAFHSMSFRDAINYHTSYEKDDVGVIIRGIQQSGLEFIVTLDCDLFFGLELTHHYSAYLKSSNMSVQIPDFIPRIKKVLTALVLRHNSLLNQQKKLLVNPRFENNRYTIAYWKGEQIL